MPCFAGLGSDDRPDYESRLARLCRDIGSGAGPGDLTGWSSIMFGYETAMLDLANGGTRIIYPTPWSEGHGEITINGLVWMGSAEEMLARIDEKINAGFRCIKLKIGGIDFDEEVRLLGYIRSHFPADRLELRLDANGLVRARRGTGATRAAVEVRHTLHRAADPAEAMARHGASVSGLADSHCS